MNIAYFITPHGFGHATRSLAVMEALVRRDPRYHFHVFSRLPRFLLDQSIPGAYTLHELECDVGLVQKSAMDIDFPGTVRALDALVPFRESRVAMLAQQLRDLGCRLAVCDIAMMGVEAARAARIPSVLVENFTWPWIYHPYLKNHPGLSSFANYFKEIERNVDHHIQAAPVCDVAATGMQVPPVFRACREPREQVRQRLGGDSETRFVLITLGGGFEINLPFLHRLEGFENVRFLIAGLKEPMGNHLLPLPKDSQLFHPDLIAAVDVVMGKVGYSTVAEVFQAGTPFGYITRDDFRESAVLERFCADHLNGVAFSAREFLDGSWIERLPELLALYRGQPAEANGADDIAAFIGDVTP